MKKIIAIILAVNSVLFVFGACGDAEQQPDNTTTAAYVEASTMAELGVGSKSFIFRVEDAEGHITPFIIKTDKTIVGEALQELGLIEGTEGDYGLYVKTVNGIFAEYETTGTYWAFYVNGKYASTGIDMTEIVEGDTYSMKIEQ